MNKKLILPFVSIILILVINTNNLFRSIENHEKWRIAVSAGGDVLALTAVVIGCVSLYRDKQKRA